ncbi:hypothetical protein FIBSPDRAFT_577890 [Athelia psychrophila]|uniref:XLF-like N-terminal domain-containing protein n=1 Tax=Athelia psychrophila TaxID=1759441 RepID=A0A166UIS6_9AGAM|nr:hypothetical protein FIBSPDRAFT_577890 [Fibularhizoctonia sp. CBS 109695]
MEQFTDEHANLLLGKEFLVKVDAASSTPYLIKYCTTPSKTHCCILITDTKKVWAEVLSCNAMARRWRNCNPQRALENADSNQEKVWRSSILDLLTEAHTLGGFADILFEAVESNYSDMAFELGYEDFKWRWEPNFLGYQMSADIMSRQLIVPLISTNHLAFSASEPVGGMSDQDLEKAVDKIGRVAKRSPDVHIRNALTKPRVATTVRRVASLLYSQPDIPGIHSEVDKPSLIVPSIAQAWPAVLEDQPTSSIPPVSDATRQPVAVMPPASPLPPNKDVDIDTRVQPPIPAVKIPDRSVSGDSATESEEESDPAPDGKGKMKGNSAAPPVSSPQSHTNRSPVASPPPANEVVNNKEPASYSDSSPVRPVKKRQKQLSSSGDDDDAPSKQARGGAPPKRGARQPIKRGGKRF